MLNGFFLHEIPMFSGGSRYVSTSPASRFSSKFDVLKNSLSARLLNSILPSVVPSWSLFSIRSPTLVLQRSGTYQSRLMVPCCHTNSLIVSSFVLCGSTVGVVVWSIAFCTCPGFSSLSTRFAMALVWTPILFSVDIPFFGEFSCLSLFFLSFCVCLNSLGCCLQLFLSSVVSTVPLEVLLTTLSRLFVFYSRWVLL